LKIFTKCEQDFDNKIDTLISVLNLYESEITGSHTNLQVAYKYKFWYYSSPPNPVFSPTEYSFYFYNSRWKENKLEVRCSCSFCWWWNVDHHCLNFLSILYNIPGINIIKIIRFVKLSQSIITYNRPKSQSNLNTHD
jgi:hypothetical protein